MVKTGKKQQRKGSSLASVMKASVTSINHVVVHLKASLAEKKHQAGTCNGLAGESGGPSAEWGGPSTMLFFARAHADSG